MPAAGFMLPELDMRGGVRRCRQTDRVLRAADHYFSVLREEKQGLVRDDYASEAWRGPPANAFAWWESKQTGGPSGSRAMAPNEVLLKLFDQWADEPDQAEARFVLTLLLVRRRVFRIEPTVTLPAVNSPTGSRELPLLRVYCARREETYDVPEHTPSDACAAEIQQRLTSLLAA